MEDEICKTIAKLETVIAAHEELIATLLIKSGSEMADAYETINKIKAEKHASLLEFVEEGDPALAAAIDDREIKDILP